MSLEFLIGWYAFLFVIWLILEKLTKCFSRLSIFTPFIYSFLIKHGIAVPFNFTVNLEQTNLEIPEYAIVRWIVSLAIMYICFIIGIIFAQKFFGRVKFIEKDYKQELIAASKSKWMGLRKIFPLFALVATVFTFITLWNPQLLILSVSGDLTADAYRAARVAYGEGVNSEVNLVFRIANTLKFAVLPFCTYTTFVLQQRNKKFKILFWFIFIATFLLNLITGQKTGVLEIVIGVVMCKIFSSGTLTMSMRSRTTKILAFVVIILVFLIVPLQYSLQYPGSSYEESLISVFHRLGGETARTLQLHFYIYPDILPHLYGASSYLLSGLFGDGQNLDPARVIRGYIAFGDITDATGSWNAAFIGTAWADFNYLGVVVQSVLVTVLLWYYHQWFTRKPKTPGVIGTYVTLGISSTYLSEANLLTTLLSFGLVSNFLLYIMFESIKKYQKIDNSSHMSTNYPQ